MDAQNDQAVAVAANVAEIEALNKTLDNMELTISVRKKEGASSQNITEDVKITNLKVDTLVMLQVKFGYCWPGSFRGEDL